MIKKFFCLLLFEVSGTMHCNALHLYDTGTALKHPNVFQTLQVFYSILFQDIVTIIQAALVLFSGLTNLYFWRSVPPKFNSELKSTVFLSFFKDKKSKRSHKLVRRNQGFSYYFCLMIEGSASISLTNGSGSGRPKNMWIRIRNTENNFKK